MSIRNNFPTIRPSLNLDFANVKALDPRITFTRTTTATYYDGKTTAKAEENLMLQSQTFNDGVWTKIRSTVTANTTAAPDGTTTAETITQSSGQTTSGGVLQPVTVSIVPTTISGFFKKSDKNFGVLRTSDGTNAYAAWFNLDTGALGTKDANLITSTIQDVGNGWYRCSITHIPTTTGMQYQWYHADTDNSLTVVDSGSTFLWGAQLEQRSAVTAYTPTTTQPITNYIPVLQTAASGVARFDHKPTTGESLGLLVEEQRTNLFTYSEQFDNASWSKTRSSITANTIVAPDGTLTGDKLVEDTTASNTHVITQSASYTSGTSYSFSVYAKAAERTSLSLQFPSGQFGASVTVSFNLSAVTATVAISGTGTSGTITAVGNGWYRCVAISQATSSGTANIPILLENTPNNRVYTGDGYSGLYLWGVQLEAGAFPTSYIPTTSATVTRNADAASMTGTNFSSWYRADEGTLYGEASTYDVSLGRLSFSVTDGSTSNRIHVGHGASPKGFIGNGGATQLTISIPSVVYVSNTFSKTILAYSNTNGNVAANGTIGVDDTSLSIPTVSQAQIGALTTTNSILNGHIRRIAYYPARLSNAQLPALTTV